MKFPLSILSIILCVTACREAKENPVVESPVLPPIATDSIIKPAVITDTVEYDTDDPAIWINPDDPAASLILGTDKEVTGALYVFDLNGKVVADKVVRNLKRPNNVDIEYGFMLGGRKVDIAVVTERFTQKLRIFSLPDMKPIDKGGISVFTGETGFEYRDLMGIALYKNKEGQIYAIVGRKNGPKDGLYLWQYLLEDNDHGAVKAKLVRKFGNFSGLKEIEAIAVDDALGYVYYSDEGFGVRKYYADPSKGNAELALFGNTGFKQDHEGISIYAVTDSTGYILVSDQQTNQFHVFTREGAAGNPNDHKLIRSLHLSTLESDGSDVTAVPLGNKFKKGLFVAMSDDKSFQYYRWEDLMK
jgi:3-phytase